MRLQRQDHIILRAEVGWMVGCRHPDRRLAVLLLQHQAVRLHGEEMRAARDEAHLRIAFRRELRADEAADRPGPEDADFHSTNTLMVRCERSEPRTTRVPARGSASGIRSFEARRCAARTSG